MNNDSDACDSDPGKGLYQIIWENLSVGTDIKSEFLGISFWSLATKHLCLYKANVKEFERNSIADTISASSTTRSNP